MSWFWVVWGVIYMGLFVGVLVFTEIQDRRVERILSDDGD